MVGAISEVEMPKIFQSLSFDENNSTCSDESMALNVDEFRMCLFVRVFFLADAERKPRTVEKPFFNGDLYFDGVSV